MAAPPGCWNAATSIPGTVVPVVCPPLRPRLTGLDSSRSSRGECASAAVAARAVASPVTGPPGPGRPDPAPGVPVPGPPAPEAPVPDPPAPEAPVRGPGRPLPAWLPGTVDPPGPDPAPPGAAAASVPEPAPAAPGTVAVAGEPTGTGGAVRAGGVANPEEVARMAAAEPPAASTARVAPAAITPLGLISIAPG